MKCQETVAGGPVDGVVGSVSGARVRAGIFAGLLGALLLSPTAVFAQDAALAAGCHQGRSGQGRAAGHPGLRRLPRTRRQQYGLREPQDRRPASGLPPEAACRLQGEGRREGGGPPESHHDGDRLAAVAAGHGQPLRLLQCQAAQAVGRAEQGHGRPRPVHLSRRHRRKGRAVLRRLPRSDRLRHSCAVSRASAASSRNTPRRSWSPSAAATATTTRRWCTIAARLSDNEIKALADYIAGLR